jgi:putative endonuclease
MGFLPNNTKQPASTKRVGDAAEDEALLFLQQQGLRLVSRNYRTPGRGGGEIDLILRDGEGTLVFVEVRRRKSSLHGTAAASVGRTKQRRVVLAAQHYLLTVRTLPPCRFDVVEVTPEGCLWLRAAFDAH